MPFLSFAVHWNALVCICRLGGTEDKFRNRESRTEDLQMITELREMVAERESLVKKLVVSVRLVLRPLTRLSPTRVHTLSFSFQDDKKFYQLELVNRDTSFNKVFNTSPNVGVINPLIKVIIIKIYIFCINRILRKVHQMQLFTF